MSELQTEPGFQLPRAKRPWWVAVIVGGVSTGAGLAGSMWLASAPARGNEARSTDPRVVTAGVSAGAALDHQQAEEAAWRGRMEQKLDDALQRISHIEGRLDRR